MQVKPILTDMRVSLFRTFFEKSPRQTTLPIELLPHRRDTVKAQRISSVEELITREPEFRLFQKSSFETKSRVDKQLEAIRVELLADRPALALKYVEELIKFQLDNSERDHLAKSLCSLASSSLAANQLDLADKLSNYALRLDIDDVVIYTTRAEILKGMGHFAAALTAYREACVEFSAC